MTRDKLIKAVSELVNILTVSEVAPTLMRALDARHHPKGQTDAEMSQSVLNSYSILRSFENSFDDTISKIISLMNLEDLFSQEFWNNILSGLTDDMLREQDTFSVLRNVNFATSQLPKILSLLERESIEETRKNFKNEKSFEIQEFIIPEALNSLVHINRLTSILSSIQRLYVYIEQANGRDNQKLYIHSIESGSPIRIKVFGKGKSLKYIKDLVLGIFDRSMLKQNHVFSANMGNINEGLQLLELVNEKQQSGSIDKEAAELLKRNILQEVTNLSVENVLTPELLLERSNASENITYTAPILLEGPKKDAPKKRIKKNKSKK